MLRDMDKRSRYILAAVMGIGVFLALVAFLVANLVTLGKP